MVPTKLSVPPLQAGLVARARLLDRLDQIMSRKLVLVSAPAGYGKTTLLAAWARRAPMPVGWLSLKLLRTAFPDTQATVEEQIAEGDKDVSRVTFRGTHEGTLFGNLPRAASPRPSPGSPLTGM